MVLNIKFVLSVVAYTEGVLQLCAAVLMAVYDEYRLWYLTSEVITLAQ